MEIIKQDILESKADMIIHQVNCLGIMGGGLAKQIKIKYPEVFEKYKNYCKTHSANKILGTSLSIKTNDGTIIANCFGQNLIGPGVQTIYPYFAKAIDEALYQAKNIFECKNIAIPYNIGCGLAGGDWNIIFPILEKIEKEYIDLNITLYQKD